MIGRGIIAGLPKFRGSLLLRNKSSSINIDKLEKDSSLVDVEVTAEEYGQREEEIEKKRNKSRLRPQDRNLLHETNPSEEPMYWYQGTLKYNRRLYGRYGYSSGVDPAICWPTKVELSDNIEYEKIAFPYKILEVAEEAKRLRQEKNKRLWQRQEDIAMKAAKLGTWRKELANKIAKKEAEVLAAKTKKERLVEEVRAHFGYTVDPRDEKFKELLEKKEKEQKKMAKEARRKERDEKMMAKLLSKKTATKEETKQEENT